MRYKGYLIEKYDNMAGAYTCRRLREEAALRDMDLVQTGVFDLSLMPGNLDSFDFGECSETEEDREGLCRTGSALVLHHGKVLTPADFVINRYKTGKIKDSVNALAGRSYNPLAAFRRYVNKFEQLKNYQSRLIPVPDSVLVQKAAPFEEMISIVGCPFVAKGLESSMGQEIFLISTPEEWEEVCRKWPGDKEWLCQKQIVTSYGRDLRLYTIRGEVLGAMVRSASEGFRANVALGAQVKPYEVTPKLQDFAAEMYECFGLDFAGIDLLFGPEGLYFCEINVMPGIEGMETATGKNVAGAVMDMILSDLKG